MDARDSFLREVDDLRFLAQFFLRERGADPATWTFRSDTSRRKNGSLHFSTWMNADGRAAIRSVIHVIALCDVASRRLQSDPIDWDGVPLLMLELGAARFDAALACDRAGDAFPTREFEHQRISGSHARSDAAAIRQTAAKTRLVKSNRKVGRGKQNANSPAKKRDRELIGIARELKDRGVSATHLVKATLDRADLQDLWTRFPPRIGIRQVRKVLGDEGLLRRTQRIRTSLK